MIDKLLSRAEAGIRTLNVSEKYQNEALKNLKEWLTGKQYIDYVPQIEFLIEGEQWGYLLDSFYQVISFGTAGRRGEVGIGPNRINPVTVRNSAQGHSQYLLHQYGQAARDRGVVLAYDVRQFKGNGFFSEELSNPVKDLTSRDLAFSAAEVYAGNGIKTFIFDSVRTTPELSFAIRYLKTVGGDVFSASHNPPTHNGKKVFDEFGGQLIPPYDEILVNEVTKNVSEIKSLTQEKAQENGLIQLIGEEIDEAYITAASQISLSSARDVNIAYTPLHGTGTTSISKVMKHLGFTVHDDPKTVRQSGEFENITFNIPNPEVIQSFETSLEFARQGNFDLLLSSDPDADRFGVMVKHKNEWVFLNGNQIASILANYAAARLKTPGTGVMVKTVVTTDLLARICEKNGLQLVDGLLIGFKYIADVMNKLEADGEIENFLFGAEESHGYLAGNYARDKDAVIGAVWLSELAAELKSENRTLIDYLNEIYLENGYFKNYVTEIRMLGVKGYENIQQIQSTLRSSIPKSFGEYIVKNFTDYRSQEPIVSDTDLASKDILVYNLAGNESISSIKITIRPSGTEPKSKVYIELGFKPVSTALELNNVIDQSDSLVHDIEKAVLLHMYQAIGVDFPERGFLLFWQLPLDDKLKYFEIEPQIAALTTVKDPATRQENLNTLLSFLGSNPIQKIDEAFIAKYGVSVKSYLHL